jgi:predicted TIM-barrel fold metal-dependent hydrolase
MLRSINFVKDLKGVPTDFLKNIYVDTSGDTTRANFQSALSLFGARRILWGSDYPAKKDFALSIQAINSLDIPKEDKQCILGDNLEEVLKGVFV